MPYVCNIVIPAHTNSQFILCTRHSNSHKCLLKAKLAWNFAVPSNPYFDSERQRLLD